MTTEILRSMLYRGSEELKEVGWVVFDRSITWRTAERGVVWEETIIFLPQHVSASAALRLILLVPMGS